VLPEKENPAEKKANPVGLSTSQLPASTSRMETPAGTATANEFGEAK
jgi:hypothetical protein